MLNLVVKKKVSVRGRERKMIKVVLLKKPKN